MVSASTVEKLVWVLIYGGLIGIALGLAVQSTNGALGLGLIVFGAIDAAVGVLLIWVRSRMRSGGDS